MAKAGLDVGELLLKLVTGETGEIYTHMGQRER